MARGGVEVNGGRHSSAANSRHSSKRRWATCSSGIRAQKVLSGFNIAGCTTPGSQYCIRSYKAYYCATALASTTATATATVPAPLEFGHNSRMYQVANITYGPTRSTIAPLLYLLLLLLQLPLILLLLLRLLLLLLLRVLTLQILAGQTRVEELDHMPAQADVCIRARSHRPHPANII